MSLEEIAYTASIWVIPVLLAVTLHEAAHGWVAHRLGDDTAYLLGRVSFNPLRHIDPFGTVVLPAMMLFASGGAMMFGFAKPVPVNFRHLRQPRRDMVMVAAAGPVSNVLLAVASAALVHVFLLFPGEISRWAILNLTNSMWINLLLAVFNMMPLPPLDGGRVAVGMLPPALARPLARLERVGIFIVLAALFILPWIGAKIGLDLNPFWWLIGGPAESLWNVIVNALGLPMQWIR